MDTRVLAYNTRLLAREDAPKTYEDLLLSKWKGKMAMDDADYIMYGSLLEMMGRERGTFVHEKVDAARSHYTRRPPAFDPASHWR